KSAVVMADELKADAILVFTIRGNMARHAAWMRPKVSPIYAICENQAVADSLTLNWGVTSIVSRFNHENPDQTISTALQKLTERGWLRSGQTAVLISSIATQDQMVDAV